MNFSERLKYLRESEELTQKELADKLKCSQSTIGNYEKNVREPDLGTLRKISEYFGVTIDYLTGNDKSKKIERAISLRDELVNLMIQRGIIENSKELDDEKLQLIELAIKTYNK